MTSLFREHLSDPVVSKGIKMAIFHICTRNGITGVMPDEQHKRMRFLDEELVTTGEQRYPRPIFTFADVKQSWLTGDLAQMKRLLEGHEVVESQFYVPFTRGPKGKGLDEFLTTKDQVLEAFGRT